MKKYQIPHAKAMTEIHVSIAFCSSVSTARAVAATEFGESIVIRMQLLGATTFGERERTRENIWIPALNHVWLAKLLDQKFLYRITGLQYFKYK
jgi:hypothetical protein